MVQFVPEQSCRADTHVPLNVEWTCSRMDSARMVCELSIRFRLLVDIAPTSRQTITIEPLMRTAPATSISINALPDSFERFSPRLDFFAVRLMSNSAL